MKRSHNVYKPRPWSKLQREICGLLSPDIKLQIHCTAYRMNSRRGSTCLPRYWITLGKDVIWDYPKDFSGRREADLPNYPYETDISAISDLLREYIDTPRDQLFAKDFTRDRWGLADILKAADRRIGGKHLDALRGRTENPAAVRIVNTRRTRFAGEL